MVVDAERRRLQHAVRRRTGRTADTAGVVTMVEPPRFMDEWQSRQNGMAQPATRNTVTPRADARRGPRPRYVQAALEGETAAVRAAPKGTRNGQLNTSALKLGRLVGAGLLEEDVAVDALMQAALAAGLTPLETDRTIRSGMRKGISDPRDPGEAQNTGQSAETRPLRELVLPGQEPAPVGPPVVDVSGYLRPAGTFLLGMPDKPEPLWGSGDTVLWAQGEALMIAGGPGLGKTTLAGQLVRARIGWQSSVLDMPVMEGGRVLYLMMDRPQQIGRRLLQQFTESELHHLDERMELGVGPPPKDMAKYPDLLLELCHAANADTVVVDSLKDAAIGLTDDEVGAGWNRARQLTVAAGVQVLELHHLVKRGANGKDPDTLADVYGSAWLTAGVGSCLVLLGDAGSPLVKVRHLKPVAEPFGPAELSHDHARGVTTVHHRVDLLELVAITRIQTPRTAACQLFDTDKPKPAETERARRALEKLVSAGKLHKRLNGTSGETTYHPLTERSLTELRMDSEPTNVDPQLTLED
jgi:hypothetical protein